MHVVLWCSKREDGRTEGHGLWITLMFHAWITLMFKEGGREDRTWWTLNYFDVSCMNYFVQKREGGRTEHHGLWITLMFQAWTTLMFKEGGREDRTSWTLIYLDVSCMYYFDVQRGRKGGQNIMDFEFLWCFMHGFIRCSKREGGRTQHHGLWISSKFHSWFTLFKEGGREDRTSWTCSYLDVSCLDVQRGREGGQNMMDFELLRCLMRECLWCSKREGGREGEHHWLWIAVMFHAWMSLMFKEGGRENIMDFEVVWWNMREYLWCSKLLWCFMHEWLWCSFRDGGRTEHHGLWTTLMFKEGGREDRTSWTYYFIVREGGREDRTPWTLNYLDVSCMNYFDVQKGREGGQNIMDIELLWCFRHELLWCSK